MTEREATKKKKRKDTYRNCRCCVCACCEERNILSYY
jgi:hypothetical protein